MKIIDVYSGNDKTDFDRLVREGYSGIIFKAGQGGWADVPRYKEDWWDKAGQAGLLRGWYWLVDSRVSHVSHKRELKQWLDPAKLNDELGFWVDVEKPQISMKEGAYRKTPYAGAQHIKDFIGFLQGLGVKPGIYTGRGAYNLCVGGGHDAFFSQFPLWTAQYYYVYIPGVSKPKMYGGWKTWEFWQYREGPDVNIFNGTDDEFFNRYGTVEHPAPPPVPNDETPPVIERPKVVVTVTGDVDVSIERK